MTQPPQLRIGSRIIGPGHPAFVIAEAGVNHNGQLGLGLELVRAAKAAGADCVKFQTFRAERVASATAPKAAYQLLLTPAGESQLAMLKKLELPIEAFAAVKAECDTIGIEFMSTPYSVEDARLLDGIGVRAFKIASGQLVEPRFLREVALLGKPLIVSTGMATYAEVADALAWIRDTPGAAEVAVLQCTTNYPSAYADANLRVVPAFAADFGVVSGYSDHTEGSVPCLGAVALGASIIEKHLTLDREMDGPDHRASADPPTFASMVRDIRLLESALGVPVKAPTEIEVRNAAGMRRSVVASADLTAGVVLTADMLDVKRPGSGIPARAFDDVIGRQLSRDVSRDAVLTWDDFVS